MLNNQNSRPVVFISHPTKFKSIADQLTLTLMDWTGNKIEVHQTSNFESAQLMPGESVRLQLQNIIREADAVLLVYVTSASAEYCMFEVGVAVGGDQISETKTRIVIFRCSEEVPKVFTGDLIYNITAEDIKKFTIAFHKTSGFFPKFDNALMPELPDQLLNRRSKELFKRLNRSLRILEPPVTYPRWISFTISLPLAFADEIVNKIDTPIENETEESGWEEIKNQVKELVKNECRIEEYDKNAPRHFDMADFEEGKNKFVNLYNRWKKCMIDDKKKEYLRFNWFDEICNQITLAVGNRPAKPIQVPLKSAREKDTWYLPSVFERTIVPAEEKLKFTISLLRMSESSEFYDIGSGPQKQDNTLSSKSAEKERG